MKFPAFHHKMISMVVLVAFAALTQGYPAPGPAATAKENPGTAIRTGDGDTPGFVEKADSDTETIVKKTRKFPWLIIALGAVAAGVVIYFLVRKKPIYTLTVTLDASCTGTPAATAHHKKGELVTYNYSAKQGYGDLKVMLDGSAVAASGSITMNRDHRITANATQQRTTLQVNSSPAGAKIYLDKVDSGFVTPHTFIYLAATTKTVLLRHHCGYQDWTQEVSVNLGQETVVNPVLPAGIREDFDIALSPCWLPRHSSAWSVGSGVLAALNSTRGYEFAFYQYALPADFAITVKQRIVQGTKLGTIGVIFSATADMGHSKGYEFAFTANKEYIIYKNINYDHYNDEGPWEWIRKDARCLPLNPGQGAWDTIKIVKAAANYTLYVNGQFVYSFVNDEYNARYVSLGIFDSMGVGYDSVLLAPARSGESVPGQPVSGIPPAAGMRGGGR